MRFFIRILIVFMVISALLSLIRSAFSVTTATPRRREPEPEPEKRSESSHLVKDPVCGTYIPENTAHRVENVFFCSDECKRKYLAR